MLTLAFRMSFCFMTLAAMILTLSTPAFTIDGRSEAAADVP